MHTQLLNIGFVKISDDTYYNNELDLSIKVIDGKTIEVATLKGVAQATIKELEDAIVSGGFGEF